MGDGSIFENLMVAVNSDKEIIPPNQWENPKDKQVGGDHYKSLKIQPYEYIVANGIGWLEGNAIKCITRYKQKGGKTDIEKAIHYLELLLKELQ